MAARNCNASRSAKEHWAQAPGSRPEARTQRIAQNREAKVVDTAALKSLHTALIDAEEGYDTAVRDAEGPEMRALFEELRALHREAHADVHAILVGRGEEPDETGSFMSMVHKTVVSVRAALTGLDKPSLTSFASGEERILKDYDAAIEECGEDAPAADRLRRHRDALQQVVSRMKLEA
jgi:uncharacterized protein (TIGR02284 family)